MSDGKEITLDDLPPSVSNAASSPSVVIPLGVTLEEAEKTYMLESLAVNRNNKSKTADSLGIGRKTLQRKLSEWGMEDKSSVDV